MQINYMGDFLESIPSPQLSGYPVYQRVNNELSETDVTVESRKCHKDKVSLLVNRGYLADPSISWRSHLTAVRKWGGGSPNL